MRAVRLHVVLHVYGAAGDADSTETSPVAPADRLRQVQGARRADLHTLADDDFSPTFLRNATAFGASPRMRFDLVVNNLAGHAWTEGVIRMESDGTPVAAVRPHPRHQPGDRLRPRRAARRRPRRDLQRRRQRPELPDPRDRRDHLADVPRLRADGRRQLGGQAQLPGELRQDQHDSCRASAAGTTSTAGAEELPRRLPRDRHDEELFDFRGHTRIKQIKHLLDTRQIDDRFFWTQHAERLVTFDARRASTAPSCVSMEPHGDERGLFARAGARRSSARVGIDVRVVQTNCQLQRPSRHDPRPALAGATPHGEAKLLRCTARRRLRRRRRRAARLADLRPLAGRRAARRRRSARLRAGRLRPRLPGARRTTPK